MSLDALINAYKLKQIEVPSLKAITLAQWILESARGESFLAREHKNFGGIKYREELINKVKSTYKVYYNEGRGEADKYYFGCKTEDVFIDLYWAFIGRAPYVGWQEAAKKGPEAYLRHIAKAGYAGDPSYVDKVLSLLPEAKNLLGEEVKPPAVGAAYSLAGVKIAFDCGHGWNEGYSDFDPGAVGNGTTEQEEVIGYAKEAARLLTLMGAKCSVFDYTDQNAKRYTLSGKGTRAEGYDIFISCHLNSVENKQVQGTEAFFYDPQWPEDKKLANYLVGALVQELKTNNRGVGHFGLAVLSQVPDSVKASCLVEPFFISDANIGGKTIVRTMCLKVGKAVAAGVLEYCKASGLAKKVEPKAEVPPAPLPSPSPAPAPQVPSPSVPAPAAKDSWWKKVVSFFLSLFKKSEK